MILLLIIKSWQCLGWIPKLLLVPPTMLPAILSAQLNGGESQPKNQLMYQSRNLLRITTSKWVVLICSIIRSKKWCWPSFACAVNASMTNEWNFFRTVQKQEKLYVRAPKRGCHNNSGNFWKKQANKVTGVSTKCCKQCEAWHQKSYPCEAHQNIAAINTLVVDQSIYVLPYTLTFSSTIIHETQNFLYCFLREVLIT